MNTSISRRWQWLWVIGCLVAPLAGRAADPLSPNVAKQLQAIAPPIRTPALRLGVFDLQPRATVGVNYDDNITLSATNRLSDVIWRITPGLSATAENMAAGQGQSLTVDYEPSFVIFTHHEDEDSIDHLASLNAKWVMPKLTLELGQRFQQTSGAVVEVGQRVRQRYYDTNLMARYQVSDKTSVEVDPRLHISDLNGLIGTTEWGLDAFLNYQVTAKFTTGLGISGGYVDVENSSSQTYERALVRAIYALSGKLDLQGSAGVEWRQFGSDAPDRTGFVFGIGGAYRPSDKTILTLEAHRRDDVSSVLVDQDYTATGVTAGLRQRLMERLFVTADGTYENRNYRSTATGVVASRQDDFCSIRVGFGANLRRDTTVTIYYQYQENRSNAAPQRFSDNQIGLEITWVR